MEASLTLTRRQMVLTMCEKCLAYVLFTVGNQVSAHAKHMFYHGGTSPIPSKMSVIWKRGRANLCSLWRQRAACRHSGGACRHRGAWRRYWSILFHCLHFPIYVHFIMTMFYCAILCSRVCTVKSLWTSMNWLLSAVGFTVIFTITHSFDLFVVLGNRAG